MKFIPMSGVITYSSATPLWLNNSNAPLANAVVIQPTSGAVKYALGSSDPATNGFSLASTASPIMIPLTAPLYISGSVQLQWGSYEDDVC